MIDAQQAAPKQEPAFWTRQRFGEEREFCEAPFTTDWTPLYTAPKQEAQEPSKAYAWVYVNKYGVESIPASKDWCTAMVSGHGGSMFPLYTAPQPTPAAQGDARAEQSLLKVLTAVQRYLPPDGPSAKDTLSEIIGIVDPWPLGDLKGKA